MAESQLYGHNEIHRYLQHEMSEQEMHLFEKALMNDPFLADALEGFLVADNRVAQNHLASIERSVTGNQQTGKVVALSVQKTRWPRLAAAVITTVTAGALTFFVVKNQKSTGGNEKIDVTVQQAMVQKDSITAADKPLAGITSQPQTRPFAQPGVSTPAIAGESIKEPKLKQPPVAAAPIASETLTDAVQATASATGKVKNGDLVPELSTEESSAAERERLQQVNRSGVDQSAKRMTLSNVMAKTTSPEKYSDTGGHPNNSTANNGAAAASTSVYNSEESRSKRTREENVGRLQVDSLSLAEIVVGTISKRKNGLLTLRADSLFGAVPVTGWNNFQQYFNRQLDSLKTTNPTTFDEDIVLEFSINERGRPTNPGLPAHLDEAVKEKIIRTLSDGPEWKASKRAEKIKLIIAF